MFVFYRRRQIKRDLAGNVTDKKGIAGIRTIGNTGTKLVSPKTPTNIMPGEFDREKDSPKKAEE